jgi:uncharacterized protein YecE (DUF72 family)
MEFGKVSNPHQINFDLKPEPTENQEVLSRHKRGEKLCRIFIGGTGWGMKEWTGLIYPAGTKAGVYLEHYARFFNTVELNSTYYRIPNPETMQKWLSQVEVGFRFCPKVPQFISHSSNLNSDEGWVRVEDFCETMDMLGEKLGICFMQLPPRFGPKQLDVLERFMSKWQATHYGSLQRSMALAVEVRHPGWFQERRITQSLFHSMEKHSVASVITDVAGRRDAAHMRLSSDRVLIRFVCCGQKKLDEMRLSQWAERLGVWAEMGMLEIYFFVHTPENIDAPAMAAFFSEQLRYLPQSLCYYPKIALRVPEGNQLTLF